MTYRLIEHTADFGIIAEAGSKEKLFEEMAEAMMREMVENFEDIEEKEEIVVEIEGVDDTDLLVRWLSEVLFYFDTYGLLFKKFKVKIDDHKLRGVIKGERFVKGKHRLVLGIKSVTYYEAFVRKKNGGYEGQVIFDI